MEKIKSIEEKTFKISEDQWGAYEGFEIATSKQTIRIGIDNSQCCCESFGSIMSVDDVKEFIGANIRQIVRVDEALNTKVVEAVGDLDEGGAMFINIYTSRGLLQFVCYNAHNGYYGHSAVVVSQQLTLTETL